MARYSRFASIEEKRNIARARRFIFLTAVALVLLFFFGLPVVIKFAAFLTDIRKSTVPIERTDTTPPAPPNLKNLPDATNKSVLTLEGVSEGGATVDIFLNGNKSELVAGEDGAFSLRLSLSDGENTIYGQAKDTAGNVSQKSPERKILFDDKVPKLEISSPADGSAFTGPKSQKVTITGTTEAEASLTINGRFVTVHDDGSFSLEVTLNEGDNPFNVKAVDTAGNLAEKNFTLKYSP